MHKYIRKLQAKPEIVRKQILIGSMIVSMFFISLIWIGSIGSSFKKEKTADTENVIKPFAMFKETISGTFNDIGASVGSIPSMLKQDSSTEAPVETEKQIDLSQIEYQ
jgi:hypothetical protein